MAKRRAGPAGDAGRHDHDHGHEHDHPHRGGALGWLRELVAPHGHGATVMVDSAMEANARGLRALLVSLAGLGVTATAQAVVAAISGSVALLGDTLHNAADALTALPLAVAFVLGRRPPTRSYTYGYGRAEDLAGMVVVLAIAASLAVLLGAGGVALGFDLADPVVGLGITVAILAVLRDAAREVYRRLMDAVDPDLVDRVEAVLRGTPGVREVGRVRLRWIGHQLRAECEVVVDSNLTVARGHEIVEEAQHRLLHELPRLAAALVHADPVPHADGADPHELTAHHESSRRRPG